MVFLSASIPIEERDKRYFVTADFIAIRDAVRALATVVIPHSKLVWGGHPAITPLIRYVMNRMNTNVREHVTIYQSNYFRKFFPVDNFDFEDIRIIPESSTRDSSLLEMRNAMIRQNDFRAGIFIGGMEGVEEEYFIFKEAHPKALLLPIASTGAAAQMIYENTYPLPDSRLKNDYAYMALFKSLLKETLNLE